MFIGGLGSFGMLGGCAFDNGIFGSRAAADRQVFDYWCTWGVQNGLVREKAANDPLKAAGEQGASAARDNLNAELIFGKNGWADYFPGRRAGLYMMLDDGWDVSTGQTKSRDISVFGSLEPDPVRFGVFGDTPAKRLYGINAALRDRGWRGAGLWVSCQLPGDRYGAPFKLDERRRDALKRKVEASAAAGIGYWKVDWGVHHSNTEYRRAISEVKNEVYPELIVEHAPIGCGVFNHYDPAKGVGTGRLPARVSEADLARLAFSDVIRIYDMLGPVEYASAVERIAYYSRGAEQCGSSVVLNVEDNPVLGAVLGHAFGIMRYPRIGSAGSVVVGAKGIAEVERAIAWRAHAPVYGADRSHPTLVSDERISAEYVFGEEGWFKAAWGKKVVQNAPAALARGTPLPEVTTAGSARPFVVASRHPNGALALGVLPPLGLGKADTPATDVVFRSPVAAGVPFAVFGRTASVTVPSVGEIRRVFAEDLAGGERHDITGSVRRGGGALTIDGETLARIGSESARDTSQPGALVSFA